MPRRRRSRPESFNRLTHSSSNRRRFRAAAGRPAAGRSGTIDGAWGSSAGLASAALAPQAPAPWSWSWPIRATSTAGPATCCLLRPAARSSSPPGTTSRAGGTLDEIAGQRLRILKLLESEQPPRLLLTTIQALIQPVPDRGRLRRPARRVLQRGETADPKSWPPGWSQHGYQHAEAVELPGEFTRRGGILDVYPPDAESPYRLEFFGDDIDSIRPFSPHTQRSLGDRRSGRADRPVASEGDSHATPLTRPSGRLPAGRGLDCPGRGGGTARAGQALPGAVAVHRGLFSRRGRVPELLRFPSVKVPPCPARPSRRSVICTSNRWSASAATWRGCATSWTRWRRRIAC